nr:MAG TPA: hypothetical protein [Caudoviricetes sp.]
MLLLITIPFKKVSDFLIEQLVDVHYSCDYQIDICSYFG